MPVDLEPAARRLGALVSSVPDGLLDAPTPCPAYTLGDLVEHVGGLSLAFAGAAVKDTGDATSQAPSGDASRLSDDWRTRIPRDLAALADAWRDTGAAQKAFDALNKDKAKPLLNRATQDAYPPGSTMKVIISAAALTEGDYTPQTIIPAGPKYQPVPGPGNYTMINDVP